MSERNYTVYSHVNKINGKMYIGITGRSILRRWRTNGQGYKKQQYFWSAIQKYGWSNFEHTIISTGLTKEEAEQMEIELIAKYNTTDREYGYNVELGGNTVGKHSDETKMKIGQAHLGFCYTDESKEKMSLAKKGKPSSFKGKKHTEEAKRKNSESHKGKKNNYLAERNKVFNARSKSVVQLDFNGNIINIFKSIREASYQTDVNRLCIANVCNGKQASTGGYKWMYLEEYEQREVVQCA
jgi:group I intron endonuclease